MTRATPKLRVRAGAAAALAALSIALGGCSLFKSDKEEKAKEAAAEQAAEQARHEPIAQVLNVEIGRTRDGFAISAVGIAPGLGYSAPELRARRDGRRGPDGFVDYDFMAKAPEARLNLGEGTPQARRLQAGLQVKADDLRGATGIRVHALSGGVQIQF